MLNGNETFNLMSEFEFLISTLVALALLLEVISFWRTNKQSESILKVKSMDKNNVLFVVTSLYNINLILISLSFLLVGIGLAKYVFYKRMYKEFYNIYLEINDTEKA